MRSVLRYLIPLLLGGLGGIVGCLVGIIVASRGSPPFNAIAGAFVKGTLWLPRQIYNASYLSMLIGRHFLETVFLVALQWGLIVTVLALAVSLIRRKMAKKAHITSSK